MTDIWRSFVALRLLPGQFGALRALRARRAQIVHINDSRTVITWAMACRLARTKLVVHQRTVYAPSRLLRLALRLALRIICISHYVYETLPLELRARAVVIPNPFAMPKAAKYRHVDREVARRELGLPPGRPVIGFVGSLTEQKRPFVFLDAATHIQAVQPPIFIMVGQAEASMVTKVESYARRQGIEDRLFMMGYRSDMERILTACDLILAPAVNEGFGRVPIEAALAGVAVVAARSGGHVEAIEDGRTGILVPPDDPVSLAAAATSLLINRSLIDTLAAAGRERAMRLYAPEVHCRKISAIYRELLL